MSRTAGSAWAHYNNFAYEKKYLKLKLLFTAPARAVPEPINSREKNGMTSYVQAAMYMIQII